MSHELPNPMLVSEQQAADPSLLERFRDTASHLRAKLGKFAVIGVLATGTLGAFVAEEGINPSVASADTLGYPWSDAPCEFGSAGGASCANPNNPYDLYDWGEYVNGVFQPYRSGYEYRNCTDYVQWKESTVGATVPSNLGNGGQWYNNAPTGEKSTTPKAWDAAVVPGNPGHVAFVESVNTDGTITVSEYNHDAQGHGDTRTGTATSMGFTEFVDFGVHPAVGGGTSTQMLLNSSNQVFAENSSPPWTSEASSGITAISAGGSTQMLLDSSGDVWAENSVGSSGWSEEVVGGTVAIAAGSNVQMLLNSSNQVFAKTGSGPWTYEAGGGITAISADGSTQMILTNTGAVYSENSVGAGFVNEVTSGTVAIAAGSNVQMLLNSSNQVFAKTPTGPWTYEAAGGITALAAAGSTQMILTSSGNVYAETSVGAGFVNEVSGGTTAIDVGDDGTQMLLNTSAQLFERNGLGSTWTYQNDGNVLISAG